MIYLRQIPYLVILCITACFLANCNSSSSSSSDVSTIRFIDTHNDIPHNQFQEGKARSYRIPGWSPYDGKQFNFLLDEAKQGQMAAQIFSVFVNSNEDTSLYYDLAIQQIDTLKAWSERNPKEVTWVTNASQFEQAMNDGKFAAMFGVEGGHILEENLDYLDSLAARGAAYLTLTWNNSTQWATSAADEVTRPDEMPFLGLNEKGREVVRKMNELGVMIDVSHLGEKSFWDVINVAKKPIIASHSCVWELTPSRRNLKDDQIDAIAATDGVIFVNFYSGFIDSTYNARYKAYDQKYGAEIDSLGKAYDNSWYGEMEHFSKHPQEMNALRPPLSALVDHIDYIAKRVGIDHIGLGADFEGAESFPLGIDGIKDYPNLARALKKRGYTNEDIQKIGWQNFARVYMANQSN